MELEVGWIEVLAADGRLPAFAARPARPTAPLPGVVVLQEAWGVDPHIQDVARRFAEAGYAVIAPDLYARGGTRPAHLAPERLAAMRRLVDVAGAQVFRDPEARAAAIADRDPAERAAIEETVAGVTAAVTNLGSHVDLAVAAADHLRAGPSRGRRVGCVGFCMGGGVSGLLACADAGIAAAVGFYGLPPPAEQLDHLAAPFLGLYGGPEKDARVTGQVPAFERAMAERGKRLRVRIYPDAMHAFFNDVRPSYDVEAARDAWAETLGFFAKELAPG